MKPYNYKTEQYEFRIDYNWLYHMLLLIEMSRNVRTFDESE